MGADPIGWERALCHSDSRASPFFGHITRALSAHAYCTAQEQLGAKRRGEERSESVSFEGIERALPAAAATASADRFIGRLIMRWKRSVLER